ncbi:MAG TPA: hypothetical protein VMF09_04980 [Solirubrobacteraceae bacterium]|nr:hypothetical protein [Solirubrobacteraceae bacterium]
MSADCSFCSQVAGNPERNEILTLIDDPWALRPVLAEVGGAVAMPSIGALVPGHALVCPASHQRSVVATPTSIAGDVQELLGIVRQRLESAVGLPTHVFEHGSARYGGRIACSVEHAHVHVLPCEADVRRAIRDLAVWRPVGKEIADLRDIVGDSEYLLYETPDGERMTATTDTGLPSQLMRQVFARELRIADWNWRREPAVERIEATVELLAVDVAVCRC